MKRTFRAIARQLPPIVILTLVMTAPLAAQEPLTMERAVALALSRNERTAIAQTRVDAAEARVRRARTFFFPELTVTGTYTRRAYETTRTIDNEPVTIQSFNALNGAMTLTATIFDARVFPLYRLARLERDGVRLSASEERRLVAFEAADAFITSLSFEQVLQATERRRELARANFQDASARFEAGLVSSNDVTRAELELATAERELIRAGGEVRIARLELGNLLNTDITDPLLPPSAFLATAAAPETPAAYSVERAQEQRPDLMARRRQAEALREFAAEPSRRIIPTLGLLAQYRGTNEAGLSGRSADGFAGVTLTWPIFDGGVWRAERAERVALARAAELGVDAATRDVELDVRRALVDIANDQASIAQAVIAVAIAKRNAEESLALYREGLAGSLEVTDANARLFEAEVAEARARYQLALAYLDLRAASGLAPLGGETS